jgi:predicted  nucleic acid-binding Zn-ribbon protein
MEVRESGPNVKDNIAQVEESIFEAQTYLRDLSRNIEGLRTDTSYLESRIHIEIDDTPKTVAPVIAQLLADFRREVNAQKDVNEHIQRQITGLKKEKSQLQQHIVASNTRAQILEDNVGLPQNPQ